MSKRQTKSLHYRRVNFEVVSPKTLEDYVRETFAKLETADDRTINTGGKAFKGLAYEYKPRVGCFIHFAIYVAGDKAATVPTGEGARVVELQAADAPENSEYSEGDFHALIAGNHIYFCCTGLRDGSLTRYLDAIFHQEDVAVPAYSIRPATAQQALRMLAEGVKEVGLNVSATRADLLFEQSAAANRIEKTVGAVVNCFASEDKKLADSLQQAEMTVGLCISTKGRIKENDNRLAILSEVGQKIIEEDEEEQFYIITRKGARITSKDISIRESARMDRFAKTVFRNEAWENLERFRERMLESGVG